jgi:hypothetical protein
MRYRCQIISAVNGIGKMSESFTHSSTIVLERQRYRAMRQKLANPTKTKLMLKIVRRSPWEDYTYIHDLEQREDSD